MKKLFRYMLGVGLTTSVLLTSHEAAAALRTWTNTAGGLWETDSNWNTVAPTNGDSANIFADGTYTILITNSTADTAPQTLLVQDIAMGNSAGDNQTLVVNFTNSATPFSFRILNVGFGGGTPTFRLEQGIVNVRGESGPGQVAGGLGTVVIAGGEMLVTNSLAQWRIGSDGGSGAMIVSGGVFTISRPFNVGVSAGNGRLEVAGGTVNATSVGPTIGNGAGSTGMVIISSGSLNLTNGSPQTTIGGGLGGNGTLTLSNGNLNANLLFISQGSANSRGTLNIHGGTALITRRLDAAPVAGATATILQTGGTLIATNAIGAGDRNMLGNAGNAVFSQSGGQSRFDYLSVGDTASSSGRWVISGGTGTVTTTFDIGGAANSTGTVIIAGGVLNSDAGEIKLGLSGAGTLITSNGVLNAKTITLAHSGGSGNIGTWNIAGGTNNISANIAMNRLDGLTSRFLMDGGELNVMAGRFNIGQQGHGSAIAIVSNGTINVNKLSVGGNEGASGGSGQLHMFGGLVSVTNDLRIGFNTGGGFVVSTGRVTVADSAILEMRGAALRIGAGGSSRGTLTNQNGGTARFTGLNNPTITLGAGSAFVTANAAIEFKDASAADLTGTIATAITYSGNNTLRLNHATNAAVASYTFMTNNAPSFAFLNLRDGGRFRATSSVLIGSGGVVSGSGTVEAPVVTNFGLISPGNSPGTLTFTSNLVLDSSSVLSFELAGTSSNLFDQVNVLADLVAGGALTVSLIDGFNPSDGDSFDILDFQSLSSGSFSITNLPTLGEGLAWDTSNLYSTGSLAVFMLIPEPSSVALVFGALALLRFANRSRGPTS